MDLTFINEAPNKIFQLHLATLVALESLFDSL